MKKLFALFSILAILIMLTGCASVMLTPLQNASDRGDINAVKSLLDKGADVNEWKYGTALMQASSKDNTDVVKLLIDRGADVNAMTQGGGSALGIAAQFNLSNIVEILIDKGADVDKAITGLKKRAAMLAASNLPEPLAKVNRGINLIKEIQITLPHKAGWAHYEKGQYQEAINSFKKAISLNPSESENFRGLSASYSALKQYDEAITAAKRAIELKPDNANAYNALGIAYSRKKQFNEALNAYKKAIEIAPKYAFLYTSTGNLFLERGDYSRAAEQYEKAISLKPNNIKSLSGLTNAYYKQGKYDEALDAADKSVALSVSAQIRVNLQLVDGLLAIESVISDHAKEADLQAGDFIIKVDGKPTKELKDLSSLRGQEGTRVVLTIKRKGVKKVFERTLVRERVYLSGASSALGYRSIILRQMGKQEEALKDAKQAYSLNSSDTLAQLALGAAYLDQGQYDEAVRLLSQVKGSASARVLEATVYAKKRDFNKAIEIYSAIPEEKLSPKNVPLWDDRTVLLKTLNPFISSKMESAGRLKAQGKYKEALKELGEAMKVADDKTSKEICGAIYRIMNLDPRLSVLPEEARKYALRGDVLTEEGKFGEAVKEYRKAVQAAPYIAKLYFNTAMIYGELKKHPQAIRHMKTYLQLAPEAPNARATKDQIYKWEFKMEKEK